MKINNLHLINYRNHPNYQLSFTDNINVIFGNNGIGKTNIIESIYFVGFLKSFRTNSDNDLINYDSDFAKIILESKKQFEIIIAKNGKKCSINNFLYKKQSEFISNLKVVLFSPETVELLLKSPNERRKYLDLLGCMLDKNYLYVIKEFYYILKQRNDYLKQVDMHSLDRVYLDVLNEKYIELSKEVYLFRKKIVFDLNELGKKFFSNFFSFSFEIVYDIHSNIDLENISTSLSDKLKSRLEREITLGKTLTGPIRDDLVFNVDSRNAKFFASKGQQRIALISLKLAEVELVYNYTQVYPILLLDDVLSELDEKRQNYLFEVLHKKSVQTIITTTDINDIKHNKEFNKITL